MDKNLKEFIELSKLFEANGYKLYLVGGTVRDFLLGKELTDMDAVTDATPEDTKSFLVKADYTFSKMGSIKFVSNGIKFDITTLRKENSYKDSRHPSNVIFVKDLKIDVIRRDFSINGMYMDDKMVVYDYVNGQEDLNKKVLKMIGDPDTRIKEDPLRIIRAARFALELNFDIDKKLEEAIIRNKDLLKLLRKEKIIQDIQKLKHFDEDRKNELFDKFGITKVINVIE